jgi:GNAT superfamily N-acetyltransferase
MLEQANTTGIVLIAEIGATFVGFVSGRIEETTNLGETPDSNRFGLVSDICVVAKFRGHRIATRLLNEIEQYFRNVPIRLAQGANSAIEFTESVVALSSQQ